MCRSKQNKILTTSLEKKQSYNLNNSAVKNIRYEECDSGNFIKQIKEMPEDGEKEVSSIEISVNSEDLNWVERQINIDDRRVVNTLKRIGGSA